MTPTAKRFQLFREAILAACDRGFQIARHTNYDMIKGKPAICPTMALIGHIGPDSPRVLNLAQEFVSMFIRVWDAQGATEQDRRRLTQLNLTLDAYDAVVVALSLRRWCVAQGIEIVSPFKEATE
ncbi:MAG: hypothetical protein C4555_06415 [Dehalococcoidia bacterium]|nr:MAG: hypothetical protein C4555_06415 [Dehalococcoidia bacterium]